MRYEAKTLWEHGGGCTQHYLLGTTDILYTYIYILVLDCQIPAFSLQINVIHNRGGAARKKATSLFTKTGAITLLRDSRMGRFNSCPIPRDVIYSMPSEEKNRKIGKGKLKAEFELLICKFSNHEIDNKLYIK